MRYHLFSGEFWQSIWVSLRRARKDSRDRKVIVRFSILLIIALLYYGPIIWTGWKAGNADNGTRFLCGIIIFCFLAASALLWISNNRDARRARIESDQSVDQKIRRKLVSDAISLSVLLARAGSEQMLREKELPAGIEVIARKTLLEQLKKLDLWNTLPSHICDLLLMPDGHWCKEPLYLDKSFETLRCLRWVLRIDHDLEALTSFPKMDYSLAYRLLDKPKRLFAKVGMVDIWDIRVERNKTDAFFTRCYAEAIARGMASEVDTKTLAWAKQTFEQARAPENRDVLVAYETVSELNEGTLRYILSVSYQRYQCLKSIMGILDGANDWDAWTALCFPVKEISNP